MNKFALITSAVILIATSAPAYVPSRIPYQAFLADGTGTPLSGTYTFTFSIYDDGSGGVPYWTSGPRAVYVISGQLNYELGSNVPFPDSLFDTSPRFLGVTIDPDPELKPRTEITSAMFALRAGWADSADGITGNLLTMTNFGGDTLKVQADRIELLDSYAGFHTVWLGPVSFGSSLRLYNTSAGPPVPNPVVIDGAHTQDLSVDFHEGAINSYEMWNEPGLAHNEVVVSNHTLGSTMQDLVTVTIDMPEDGYILLFGRCYVGVTGTTSSQGGYIQVDDGAGGGLEVPSYTFAGANGFPDAGVTAWWPVTTDRIFFRNKGTYTFRLEGQRWTSNGTVGVWNPVLTAVYLSTAYGTVAGTVPSSEAAGFESVKAVSAVGDETTDPAEQNLVQVNLAELEHRALEARLKALQAELDAQELEIKLEAARKASGDSDRSREDR